MELISVIVPVYNVEQYLHRCIDSIISQTYHNLEIILVDDGSTDASPAICDEYERLDSRVWVIHKKNGGVSEARNMGLNLCSGNYIAFVDSDDYILNNMYEILYNCTVENNVDIGVCCWQWEALNGDWTVRESDIKDDIYGKHTAEQFEEFFFQGRCESRIVGSPINKLYRKCLFNEIRYHGHISEDEEVNDLLYAQGATIYVVKNLLYINCENTNSVSRQQFNSNWYNFFTVLKKKIILFPENEYIANQTALLFCNIYIEYYYRAEEVGIQPFCDPYQYRCFRRNAKTNVKTKLRFLLFEISPWLYKKITKWINQR